MQNLPIIDDLYRYNSWANDRILAMCRGLTDAQFDEPRELGFGSLRKTLFHLWAAEQIWLERWRGLPWRPLPTEAAGLPIRQIAQQLEDVAATRQALIDHERPTGWQRVCHYQDSQGNAHKNRLIELLLHVANHGIHHRAQALHYLKAFGQVVPGGLDYLFFRLAKPNVLQEPATRDSMRQYGMEVETGSSPAVGWDGQVMRDYFAYSDWGNNRLLGLVASLDDSALDRSFGMGMGTIRKTALHIADAERWWQRNWTVGPSAFDKAAESTSIAALRENWTAIVANRGRFLATLDEEAAQRVVTVLVGPLSIRVPVIESLVQLCGHGTHHRAQLVNMLRRSQVKAPGCDYILWLRETA